MTNDTYTLLAGNKPLLISMPHNGEKIPDDIASHMTDAGLAVDDTDWYLDQLYDFAISLGAWVLVPKYNRYVIDLNRDPTGANLYPGANSTELCPTTGFDLSALYKEGFNISPEEQARRVTAYWQPYHNALENCLRLLKDTFGVAVLLEAHSIRSHVPRFFEGQLPDFNYGTNDGESCADALIDAVNAIDHAPYSKVVNGRFKGGYITRHYGQPSSNIHSIQLELSQRTYMQEPTKTMDINKANDVKVKLRALVESLIAFSLGK